jgi:sulfatase maturation enzyme AslB (radical SAM superfamily)
MTKIPDIFLPLKAKKFRRLGLPSSSFEAERERCKYCVELVRKSSSFAVGSSSFRMSTDNTDRFILRILLASDSEETFNVHISVG